MKYSNDKRIVMTLDAGGTNFVFSAIQSNKEIVEPVTLLSNGANLKLCLDTIVEGFTKIKEKLADSPCAISFAFPGPCDYPNGIIGDLENLPGFRGGIALGPMLREIFEIPVYLNNDGDLFTYGEALGGFLPEINEKLRQAGSPKQYKNLFGITLGTGFGGGIVRNGELFIGDNSSAGEIWITRNKVTPRCYAEEGVSIRAIQRVYNENAKVKPEDALSPKEIYEIATGKADGDKDAALKSFDEMAEIVGDALANAITLIDGLIVIGGGLSGAAPLFMPRIVKELNSTIESIDGNKLTRLDSISFNLEDENELKSFIKGKTKKITVPGTNKTLSYDPMKRIGIGLSKLGTNHAVSIGAYAFALNELDR